MHLLYIDDSGDDGRSASSTSHFVLGGLTIQDWNWHPLVKRIDEIAGQYLGKEASRTELHAYDMLAGKGPFRKVPPEVREGLFTAVLDEVGRKESRLSLFLVVVHKDSLPITRSVRVVATLQLYQRFNSYLTRMGAYRQQVQERGMLVCDEHASRQQVQSLVAAIHSAGVPKQLTDNLIETAFFVESQQSRLLQLADLVCHAAYRFVTVQDARFFPLVERKIDRDKKPGAENDMVHYGFRYIASAPDAGLAGPLPFKETQAHQHNPPAGRFVLARQGARERTGSTRTLTLRRSRMADCSPKDISAIVRDGTAIDEAIVRAQQRVVRRHRQLGVPLAVWQDGRVVEISPVNGGVLALNRKFCLEAWTPLAQPLNCAAVFYRDAHRGGSDRLLSGAGGLA